MVAFLARGGGGGGERDPGNEVGLSRLEFAQRIAFPFLCKYQIK